MSLRVIALAVCFLASMIPSSSFAQGENVELVGSVGSRVDVVTVRDGYAYIGVGPYFGVLDVSDSSAPEIGRQGLLSHLDEPIGPRLPDIVRGVGLSGSLAYVADRKGGLQIIDVSDPSAPALLGAYDTQGFAEDVAVSGSLAYVAGARYLLILDVWDPSAPVLVGSYHAPGGIIDGVALSGSLVYVANNLFGFEIYRYTGPIPPTPTPTPLTGVDRSWFIYD